MLSLHIGSFFLKSTVPLQPFGCPTFFSEIPDVPFLTQVTMTSKLQCDLRSIKYALPSWAAYSSGSKCDRNSYLFFSHMWKSGINSDWLITSHSLQYYTSTAICLQDYCTCAVIVGGVKSGVNKFMYPLPEIRTVVQPRCTTCMCLLH